MGHQWKWVILDCEGLLHDVSNSSGPLSSHIHSKQSLLTVFTVNTGLTLLCPPSCPSQSQIVCSSFFLRCSSSVLLLPVYSPHVFSNIFETPSHLISYVKQQNIYWAIDASFWGTTPTRQCGLAYMKTLCWPPQLLTLQLSLAWVWSSALWSLKSCLCKSHLLVLHLLSPYFLCTWNNETFQVEHAVFFHASAAVNSQASLSKIPFPNLPSSVCEILSCSITEAQV